MDGNNIKTDNTVIVKKQSRLRSWALWVSVAALAVWCVKTFAGVDISPQVSGLLDVLCPVFVGFGIINDPTNSSGI